MALVPTSAASPDSAVSNPATHHHRQHVLPLDGLRGVAILLVVLVHASVYDGRPTTGSRIYMSIAGFGWTGVDLFFVLSGFLITGILLHTKQQPGYFRNFFARRTLRVFPLYYGLLALIFVIAPLAGIGIAPTLVHNQLWLWTYLANWRVAAAGDWQVFNGGYLSLVHLWSLAVEEQFYLVWPLLVYFLPRRALVITLLALILIACALRIYLHRIGLPDIVLFTLTPCRMDALAIGSLIAIFDSSPWFHRCRVRFAVAGFILGLIWIICEMFRNGNFATMLPRIEMVGFTLIDLWYGCILILVIGLPRPHRWLSAGWLRAFGRYSYGIYLLHGAFIPMVIVSVGSLHLDAQFGTPIAELLAKGVFATLLFFAAAWLTYRVIERPFLRLKRYFEYQQSVVVAT